ncbi:MAG: FAD-binding protein, partial [Caldilineaceae bacterium]|nr:FAD-binding protein [Caldilineaceae bacterium]
FHQPATLAELQNVVRNATKVKVIGARHCFNDIADTTGDMISLANMDKSVTIDHEAHTATVNAGITYGELAPQLHAAGYALHNMASLHHITVIGACMTATHGSGDKSGNLATAVAGLEMVTANGDVVTLTRSANPDSFPGAVVALGALGAVTKVTLDLLPTFEMHQEVYEWLPMRHLDDAFDAIMSSGYSVSLFPKWQSDAIDTMWVKQKVVAGQAVNVPSTLFDAKLADHTRPLEDISDRYGTKVGAAGPWHERMPHFVFKDAEQVGDELQSEYFVPRQDAVAAMKAVAQLREGLAPILGVSEIRSVAADDLWLSTAYGYDIIGIHFNWRKNWAGVSAMLPVIEEALAPFNPRPHWGKLFALTPAQVQAQYPRMADFRALCRQLDPQGKFRNAYVERYIFGE